ncbi:MAG: hypothetical protein D6791_17500, partial [Chloroflexi bacterium]
MISRLTRHLVPPRFADPYQALQARLTHIITLVLLLTIVIAVGLEWLLARQVSPYGLTAAVVLLPALVIVYILLRLRRLRWATGLLIAATWGTVTAAHLLVTQPLPYLMGSYL